MSKARATADVVVTSVFVSCTLGMAFFCVGGHFWPAGEPGSSPVVENWRGVREFGILLGQADAPLVVTAFMDFTCPFSRSLALVTDSLLRQRPNDVALAFLHFPLQGRTPSPPPAVALECADRAGRFPNLLSVVAHRYDPQAVTPWEEYALEASIESVTAFVECVQLPSDSFPRISLGRAFGDVMGITGVPTVWLNGRPFGGRTLADFRTAAKGLGLPLD